MKLAIVIPVYNEEPTLAALIQRLLDTPPPPVPGGQGQRCERVVYLIDDGSRDRSPHIARELAETHACITALVHERNRGKGAALKTGFQRALADGADLCLVQDADLEYDPADHAAVLAPILEGKADVVIGSRFIGQTHRVLYYWHAVANRFITILSNMLTNLNLTDIECCLKAFTRDVLEPLELHEPRFGIEPELVAKVAKHRDPRGAPARVYEVAVSYAGRTYAEGKKITWRDGVSAIRCILKYNLLG